MKRQFKHIQTNTIVNSLGNGYYETLFTNTTISSKYIENTNDWVEIISKPEYTILSFKFIPNGNIWKLQENGTYNWDNKSHNSEKDFFTPAFYYIHSVRRESDGEVFTVGDNVRLNFNVTSISKLIKKIAIEKVGVCPEKLFIYTDGEQSTINNYVKTQPKEWEITSLTSPHGPVPVIDPIGFDSLLNNLKGYTIRSIKRLSDNVEFKIGDKVDSIISNLGRPTDLTGFKVIDNKLTVGLRHLGYYPLQSIILPKKPLFITEDGVNIYEGKEVFVIHPTTLNTIVGITTIEYSSYKGWLFFSTEQALEEYILMNKPCLSLNDLNVIGAMTNHNEQKLKELVKTKL